MVTGISCIVAGFIEEGALRFDKKMTFKDVFTFLFRTAIALGGKLFSSGSYSVVYIYTAEIYPTVIRFTYLFLLSIAIMLIHLQTNCHWLLLQHSKYWWHSCSLYCPLLASHSEAAAYVDTGWLLSHGGSLSICSA